MMKSTIDILARLLAFVAYSIGRTVAGATCGFIVGLVFWAAIENILNDVGIFASCWEFGAFLGFVTGFAPGSLKS